MTLHSSTIDKEGWVERLVKLKIEINEISREIYGYEWWEENNALTNLTCNFDEAIAVVEGLP